MGSPSRNVQYHPPRLSEDRLNLPQPHSPSLPTHCSGKSGMRPTRPNSIASSPAVITWTDSSAARRAPAASGSPALDSSITSEDTTNSNLLAASRHDSHVATWFPRITPLASCDLHRLGDRRPGSARTSTAAAPGGHQSALLPPVHGAALAAPLPLGQARHRASGRRPEDGRRQADRQPPLHGNDPHVPRAGPDPHREASAPRRRAAAPDDNQHPSGDDRRSPRAPRGRSGRGRPKRSGTTAC